MQRMMLLPQTNRADGRGFKSPRGKVFFCMNLKWVRERLKWKEIQTRCLLMSDWKSRFSWVHSVEFHLIPSFRKIERGREKAQWSESLLKKEKAQWTETLLMRRKKVAGAKLKQIGCVGSQRILIFVSNDEKKKSLNQKFFSAKWLFDERSFYLIVFLCVKRRKLRVLKIVPGFEPETFLRSIFAGVRPTIGPFYKKLWRHKRKTLALYFLA